MTSADLADIETKARDILAGGAHGFGELAARHLSYKASPPYVEIAPTHPLLMRVARVAAQEGVPLDIHLELVARDTIDAPDDFTPTFPDGGHCFNNANNNPETLTKNLDLLEQLLSHSYDSACAAGDCNKARIVWSHVGWDNIGDMTTTVLRELLDAHPNLYLSLKLLDTPSYCQEAANRPLVDTDGNYSGTTPSARIRTMPGCRRRASA